MNVLRYAAGGLAGGMIGAAIWAAIAYLAHVEIGWVAWGIGGLVGLGVRYLAGDTHGPVPGATAAVVALLSVQAGKVIAVLLVLNNVGLADLKVSFDREDMVVALADAVAGERAAQNKPVRWPAGVKPGEGVKQADFPADVWQEAARRWEKLGPAEQRRQTAEREAEMNRELQGMVRASRWPAVKASYTAFDLLWCGLAMLTAFRLGSGASSS